MNLMLHKWKNIGYAMSNIGLEDQIDDEIRAQHPDWTDENVIKERKKIQKKSTIFNLENKRPKKSKKPKKVEDK